MQTQPAISPTRLGSKEQTACSLLHCGLGSHTGPLPVSASRAYFTLNRSTVLEKPDTLPAGRTPKRPQLASDLLEKDSRNTDLSVQAYKFAALGYL